MIDKRSTISAKNESFLTIPGEINESDVDSWKNGVRLLDDLATERLRKDISTNLGNKYPLLKPLLRIAESVNVVDTALYLFEGYHSLHKRFGTEQVPFERQLARMSITGDSNEVEKSLRGKGYASFAQFAIELGRKESSIFASQTAIVPNRLLLSLFAGGVNSAQYEGIIMRPMIKDMATFAATSAIMGTRLLAESPISLADNILTVAAIAAFGAAFAGMAQFYNNTLHELCHYITRTENKQGLHQLTIPKPAN